MSISSPPCRSRRTAPPPDDDRTRSALRLRPCSAYIRGPTFMGDPMTYEDIVSLLGYAGGHEQAVRITTTDRTEVVGIPMSVDTHVTAHEVYLRPAGSDDTEI